MKIEEYDGFNNTPFEGRFDMQCALAAHPVLHRFHPGFAALCNNPVMPAEFLAQVYRVISKDIPFKLGDTVRVRKPVPFVARTNGVLDWAGSIFAWGIPDPCEDVLLDTQEKVDEFNARDCRVGE